jgi:hypothetical protein
MYCENMGKPAPARERSRVLPAMADAALGRKESAVFLRLDRASVIYFMEGGTYNMR